MPDEKFKLPQSSYEELVKIIKAYGHIEEPAGLEDISKLVGLHTTIISRNAGFLITTGILEGGAKKIPTSQGRELAHALEHQMPNEIRKLWQHIIHQNDFLSKLLTAIRIRNGMDEQTLEAHIAYSAGQPKRKQFMTGARTIIDILRAGELIKEADGKIIVKEAAPMALDERIPGEERGLPSRPEAIAPEFPQVVTSISPAPGVQISIQININCSPDEVEALGSRLKSMIETLAGKRLKEGTDSPKDE